MRHPVPNTSYKTKTIINKKIITNHNQYTMNSTYMPVTKRDTHFINIAFNASQNSTMLMKHGACVVENNTVIGVGCNSSRTQFKDNFIGVSCSCHAEMNALYKAIKNKKACKSKQCSSFSVSRKRKPQRVLHLKGNKGNYV